MLGGHFNLLTAVVASTLFVGLASGYNAVPFVPSSVPLAVRSPYTSTWLPSGKGATLAGTWPTFWQGAITGWTGYVRVDSKTYTWMGNPNVAGSTLATQKSLNISATRSTFVLSAGGVDLTASFFSPVEVNDFTKGSLPFSYLSVSVKSTDGKAHSVQVYSDISGEWVSTDSSKQITWSTSTASNTLAHQVQLAQQTTYGEAGDMVQSGSAWYGIRTGGTITYQTGADTDVRGYFINNGKLANTKDTGYRAISDRWPVVSFAQDLGSVSDTSGSPIVFGVGHARSPSIQYITKGNVLQDRFPYYAATYSTPLAALNFFLSSGEYSRALSAANTLDAKIQNDGASVSQDYANILKMSARQVMGALEITISKKSDGSYNTGDVYVFMKEISSDGNMNTVDVIFPTWPFFLYMNPRLGAYLLQPLFIYQQSGLYPNKWSIHDLGASYPKALGHNDGGDEAMPVEESGNMLIMALSYAQKSGDNSVLSANYNLLKQWTGYLVSDSLIPGNQLSTDDFEGKLENQTNLAIKGIVGIRAMGQIASILGNTADANNYNGIAADYVTKMLGYATSKNKDHLTLAYGQDSTWGLTYNMYGDKLLKLNLFPASLFTMQNTWYSSHGATYGVPLDTRHLEWTKSDWQIFTAAISTTTAVRDLFIKGVAKHVSGGTSTVPFSDWYDTNTGGDESFRARPVVGGHFAILALR